MRVIDSYQAWPASETPWSKWRQLRAERDVRGTAFGFAFVVGFLLLFFGILYWLTR